MNATERDYGSNTGTLAKGAGIEPARLAAAFKELER